MLPDWLKKLLQAMGVNTVRLEWKLRFWREKWNWDRVRSARWTKVLSYEHKFCSCGLLVDKDAKECPGCGQPLGSRTSYRIGRALGFVVPGAGLVWTALLVVIATVFVAEWRLGGMAALFNPPGEMLVDLGALFTPAVVAGEYWRLLSAGLIHIGLWHIGFNAIALSQLAPPLEEETGSWQFLVLVTVAQLGCTVLSLIYHRPVVLSAGASGIAFGLIGFGLAYSHRQGGRSLQLRALYMKWAIYGFLFGVMIGADNAGHLGGLIAGGALGFAIPTRESLKQRLVPIWRVLAVICLMAWAYTLFMMWRSAAG